MKAFQQIGWLCGRPMLHVVRQGEALPRGVAEFAYREEILKPNWWRTGTDLTIAQQFQAYLAFLGGAAWVGSGRSANTARWDADRIAGFSLSRSYDCNFGRIHPCLQ